MEGKRFARVRYYVEPRMLGSRLECVRCCATEKDVNDALRGEPDTKVFVDIAVDELCSFACHDLSSCRTIS